MDIPSLQERIRHFADEREWGQFHTPKNLAMGLAAEAGELLEVFQWLSEEESKALSEEDQNLAANELADVLVYTLPLADVMAIDIDNAVENQDG